MSRPSAKPATPVLQLGFWEAVSQPGFDCEQFAKDLYETPAINSAGLHLMSPWQPATNFYPFPFVPAKKKFDLSKDNEEWYTQFTLMCDRLAWYSIGIHIKLFDQYGDEKYLPKGQFHPLIHNTMGVRLMPQELYESWDRSGLTDKDFAWLIFTAGKEPTSVYRPQPIGKHMKRYMERVAKILKATQKKYPDWHIVYTVFNEERIVYDPATGHEDAGKSIGAEDKIKNWIYREIMIPAKLRKNEFFVETVDNLVSTGYDKNTEYGYLLYWPWMDSQWINEKQKAVHEIHRVSSVNIINLFRAHGYPKPGAQMMWSQDGIHLTTSFFKDTKALIALKLPRFEMIFADGPFPSPNLHDDNNKTWRDMWGAIKKGMKW